MSTSHDTHALLAHVGWVRSLAAQLVRDDAAAEDLAQETLLAAWRRPPRDPSALRGYLGSVLRNLLRRGARDADRRAAREHGSARSEVLPSAADTAERLATHRRIVAAVEALAEPYRTVVLLRHFEELPPRGIAARLGVPVKTVETRLTRAHALLRERLDADHGGDRKAWAAALARFAGPESIAAAPSGASSPPWWGIGAVAAAAAVAAFLAIRASRPSAGAAVASLPSALGPSTASALSKLGYSLGPSDRLPVPTPPERAQLRGSVVSGSGAPIAGAEISVSWRPADGTRARLGAFGDAEDHVGTATSLSDGSWELEVPAHRLFDVRVRARGFGGARRPLVDPEARLDVRLGPAATLALSVTDASGAAVPGARVEVFAPAVLESARSPVAEGPTDALGGWRSDELAAGVYRVEVSAATAPKLRLANVALRGGDAVDRDVRLSAGVEIAGTVRSARSGEFLAGVQVRLDGDVRGTTDGAGRYRIGCVDPEASDARVELAAPGWAGTDVRIDPRKAATAPTDVELVAGHAVAGKLRGPGGMPIAGAWVAAYGHVASARATPTDWVETRTDATGAFLLEGLRPDLPHALFVRSPGLATLVRPLARGREGERADLGDVLLAPGASIEGRVLRDDGAPAAGAVVQLEAADGSTPPGIGATVVIGVGSGSSAPTDDLQPDRKPLVERDAIAAGDGSFRVHDLAAGRWRVVARIGLLRSGPVETEIAASGAAKDLCLRIPRGLAIEGRVVDEEDRPLGGAWVLLCRKGRFLEDRSVETDVDGRFRMDGLEALPYRLTAGRAPSGSESGSETYVRAETGDLVPPSLDLVVRLARAVRLEGQVVDAAGRPLARALVDGRDAEGRDVQAVSDAAGRFHLDVAANARLELRGNWPGPGADASGGRRLGGILSGVDAGTVEVVLRLDASR